MSEVARNLEEKPSRIQRIRDVAAGIARLLLQKERDLPFWRVEEVAELDSEDSVLANAREHLEIERLIHEL